METTNTKKQAKEIQINECFLNTQLNLFELVKYPESSINHNDILNELDKLKENIKNALI